MSGQVAATAEDGRLHAVIIARKHSSNPRAVFAMSHRDAVALCSDPRSKGRNWMAVHAPIVEWQEKGEIPARLKIKDTGSMDSLIEELGLTKHEI